MPPQNTSLRVLALPRAPVPLNLDPVPAKRGDHPLPRWMATILDELIDTQPTAAHGAIARQFAHRTGRVIGRSTVAKRRQRRPEASRLAPFTPEQVGILLDLIRVAGPIVRRVEIARQFRTHTGRAIAPTTVSRYAIHSLGFPQLKGGRGCGVRAVPLVATETPPTIACPEESAAYWPAWTDELSVDVPWSEDDFFMLGPNALPIGGAI